MRRNVARAARVAIVPPGAADIGALLDDEKGIHARLEKFDAHAKAGEAGADDENVDGGFRGVRMRGGGCAHAWVIFTLLESAPAACARRNSLASRRDARPSGIMCAASCQACGTTGQILSSTGTPA